MLMTSPKLIECLRAAGLAVDSLQIIPHLFPVATRVDAHALLLEPEQCCRRVVMAPGYQMDAERLRYLLAGLLKRGTGVILYGAPGHNTQATPYTYGLPESYGSAAIIEGLKRLVHKELSVILEKCPNRKPVHLWGHCMGGTSVAHLLLFDDPLPDTIRSVTLVNPALQTGPLYDRIARPLPSLARFLLWVTRGHLGKYRAPVFRIAGLTNKRAMTREAVGQTVKSGKAISVPNLWALYPKDRQIKYAEVVAMAQILGGTGMSTIEVGAHSPFGQEHLDGFLDQVHTFWDGVDS